MTFERRYSPPQREAVELAWGDAGIRPAERISELARRGELRDIRGAALEPFELPAGTVRAIGARYLRRRAGRERERVLIAAPDPVEQLRRRLLVAIDDELAKVESQQRRQRIGGRPPRVSIVDQLRAIGRATRELAALPAPGAAPPAGAPPAAVSQRGLAAAIVRANASGAAPALEPVSAPAQELSPYANDGGESAGAAQRMNESAGARELEAPGTLSGARLGASAVRVR